MDISTIVKAAKEYLPDLNEKRLVSAYDFAKKAHDGQKRSDGSPYSTHPLATAKILTEFKVDEDTLITAFLHDVPEDTKYTLKDIEKMFGKKVSCLVEGVTKLSKVQYKHDMAERQIESLKRLFFHSAKDLRIILVKLADRLHNMRTLQYLPIRGKRIRIAKESLEIYAPIANLLGIWEIKSEMEDLCFEFLYPDDFKRTKQLVEESSLRNDEVIHKTVRKIKISLTKHNIKAEVRARKKNLYSIFKKMLHTGKTFHDIYDLVALRIIVEDIDACYRALGVVHQTFRPKHKRVKDYIAVPKVNGYQSLHTTVFGVDGTITEFQIRTYEMHLEAEYGIAAHYFYNASRGRVNGNRVPSIFKKHAEWAKKVLAIQKEVQTGYDFVENLKFDIFQDRIFVFTPQGDVIDLPYGANAVDFAYHIHSDVGNEAANAEINGERLPLTTQLNTGDTIKINRSKSSGGPHRGWLILVKTGLARTKIKEYFKKESSQNNYAAGLRVLKRELQLFGKNELKKLPEIREKEVLEKFDVDSIEALMTGIGEGNITVRNVIHEFYTSEEILGKPTSKSGLKDDDLLSKRRFDHAMAIVLGNEELKEKADKNSLCLYRVEINIICHDRVGLLKDIALTLSSLGVNIHEIKMATTANTVDRHMVVIIDVCDLEHLEEALRALTVVRDVVKIYKSS
ncbi:MAG: RelA/SpoT family protein [Patescibacteria group bacterium]|nr:RelA/SpoT family protein [Patescibacteria group bacterium]